MGSAVGVVGLALGDFDGDAVGLALGDFDGNAVGAKVQFPPELQVSK